MTKRVWMKFAAAEVEGVARISEVLGENITETVPPYISINLEMVNGPFFTLVEEHAAMGIPDFVSNIGGILGVYMGIRKTLF